MEERRGKENKRNMRDIEQIYEQILTKPLRDSQQKQNSKFNIVDYRVDYSIKKTTIVQCNMPNKTTN